MDETSRRDFIRHTGGGLISVLLPVSVFEEEQRGTWEAVMKQRWDRPHELNSFSGVRPRLFLTADRLERLKNRIGTSHKAIWEVVLEKADAYLKEAVPLNYESQGEMRSLGRGIPWQALAYRLTADAKYLSGAKKWVLEACRLPRWENNKSLAGGECLFGVAIGYDWLWGEWTKEEREFIREKLVKQAQALKDGPPVHHDRWLANHNHVEHNGLAAAGFALFDEIPEAIDWIRQADLVFQTFLKFASHDGSSTEGHQYWAYTAEAVLRYLEMARDLLGRDYYDSAWLKSASSFIIFSTLPDFTRDNCVMSFGDSHRDYASHGPTHILYRLAAEYRNPHAQWLAREMERREVGRGDYCTWLNLLWYDEALATTPVSSLPAFWNCDDIEWVTMRSSWQEDAVMVGFKCGPMHGHKAQEYYDAQFRKGASDYHCIGGGHGHPDVNSIQIYAYGKWLAIDPLYERPKWTQTHNTLLVNGRGQLGEGQTWFDRESVLRGHARSRLMKAESGKEYDFVIGDAENIYSRNLGLKRFLRYLVYIRPDVIVVLDEVKANEPSNFEWLLHGEQNIQRLEGLNCLVRTDEVGMDVHFLLPQKLDLSIEGKSLKALCRQMSAAWILTVLHPRKLSHPRSEALCAVEGEGRFNLNIRAGERELTVWVDALRQHVEVSQKGES